uniref:Uncharacterized protein n=1 Tax=Callorhinchus milii TaxID=7868 RepID=A0A4W3JMG4_CALMI
MLESNELKPHSLPLILCPASFPAACPTQTTLPIRALSCTIKRSLLTGVCPSRSYEPGWLCCHQQCPGILQTCLAQEPRRNQSGSAFAVPVQKIPLLPH